MANKEEKKGLELLSDDVLAQMVEEDIAGYGELTAPQALTAFEELSKRTPKK